jgi:hypothetical protein
LQGGVLPFTYTPTDPHDHHARLPNTTPQRPGIPLFQRSVLPSHPLITPRPPTIVYPHRASSTPPLASASTPPHEPYLFLAADPTQRQQLRTSACAPRHCCTNTVVCRARRTRGSVQSKMAVCHSARERSVGRCREWSERGIRNMTITCVGRRQLAALSEWGCGAVERWSDGVVERCAVAEWDRAQ